MRRAPIGIRPRSSRPTRVGIGVSLLIGGAIMTPIEAQARTRVTHGDPVERITIVAEAEANGARPISVEIVAVFTEAALRQLSTMTAGRWFAGNAALMSNANVVSVYRLEVSPDSCASLEMPEIGRGEPTGVFVFAGYEDPGVHRGRIEMTDAVIELRGAGFNLTEHGERHVDRCVGPL